MIINTNFYLVVAPLILLFCLCAISAQMPNISIFMNIHTWNIIIYLCAKIFELSYVSCYYECNILLLFYYNNWELAATRSWSMYRKWQNLICFAFVSSICALKVNTHIYSLDLHRTKTKWKQKMLLFIYKVFFHPYIRTCICM